MVYIRTPGISRELSSPITSYFRVNFYFSVCFKCEERQRKKFFENSWPFYFYTLLAFYEADLELGQAHPTIDYLPILLSDLIIFQDNQYYFIYGIYAIIYCCKDIRQTQYIVSSFFDDRLTYNFDFSITDLFPEGVNLYCLTQLCNVISTRLLVTD